MSYWERVSAKHFYRLQKILGLSSQLMPIVELAGVVLEKKGKKPHGEMSKKKARYIVEEYMREIGVLFSGKRETLAKTQSCVYFIQQQGGEMHLKIGCSDNVDSRIKKLQTGSPYPLKCLAKVYAVDKYHALIMEKSFHDRLRRYKLSGEWFSSSALGAIREQVSEITSQGSK